MVSLNTHIAYLIRHHDCVIVPEWGAFISACGSAHYDAAAECWAAPERTVAFNPELNHNDGLLAGSIMRSSGCSYAEALSEISANVGVWHGMLKAHGTMTLPAVGTFKRVGDGVSPEFVPCRGDESAANACYCGLPRIAMLPIAEESRAEDTSEILPAVSPRRAAMRIMRRAAGIAASVAIVASVVVAFLSLTSRSDSPLYMASLWDAPAVAAAPADRQLAVAPDAELRIAMVSAEVGCAEVDTMRTPQAPAASTSPASESHRYFLIVSSLASQAEADRFIATAPAELRANMRVLVGERRYRVYVATGSTFAEANSHRHTHGYATRYPDAWVYVKNS